MNHAAKKILICNKDKMLCSKYLFRVALYPLLYFIFWRYSSVVEGGIIRALWATNILNLSKGMLVRGYCYTTRKILK